MSSSVYPIKARLIVVRLRAKDEGLDRDEDLQDCRGFIPLLSLGPLPCTQEGKTDFAAVVEVWVEPDEASASGPEVHHWRNPGILRRKVNIELVASSGVRCFFRPAK